MKQMMLIIFNFFKIPTFFLLALTLPFLLSCIAFFAFYHHQGYRLKSKKKSTYRRRGKIKRIFLDAPKQIIIDMYDKEPDFFQEQGLVIFTGCQGSGKTSALVQQTLDLQKKYHKVKVISNLGYTKANKELSTWQQLLDYKNGILGVIVQMDELQNWFSSKQSQNFPPEMLSIITQNRKNRRLILGTAQNFYMLAKDIRTQCTELRQCLTLCGCVTLVHRVRPICDSSGEVKKLKHLKFYFFVHGQELRGSYDTYKIIESLSKAGFKEKKEIKLIS